jgi:hypothetical protein
MLCYPNFIILDIVQKFVNVFGSGFWGFVKVVVFFSSNVDGFFFLIWFFLLSSMFLNWASNPIYRIINLAVISLLMVFMWGYSLDFTFILLCYVIAFTSAVVMLFLSVVLMLPASTVSSTFQNNSSVGLFYITLLYSDTYYIRLFSLQGLVDILVDFFIVLLFLVGVFLLLYCLNKAPVVVKDAGIEKFSFYQIPYKNLSFLAVLHTSARWDFFEIQEPYKLLKLFFKNYDSENQNLNLVVGNRFELFCSWPQARLNTVGPRLYFVRRAAENGCFVVNFFFELFWFLITIIEFFITTADRHRGVLCIFKTLKSWFAPYDYVSGVVGRVELRYLVAHRVWESEKLTYPSSFSNWHLPVVFIAQHNSFVRRVLAFWSPFRVFYIFKLCSNVAGLATLKNGLMSCLDALVQGVFVILLFITITPVDFKFFDTSGGISRANDAKVVNFDSLVELKHLLYEDMPLFIFVSVLLLLIALLSVSILKKK